MKAKFINEDITDVLKPKNIVGKCYGIKSSATHMLEYIIKIEEILETVGHHPIYSILVVYNNFMIEGGQYFDEIQMDDGAIFSMIDTELIEFINSYSFEELSEKPIKDLEHKIYELTEFKKFLQKLYNESKAN